MQKKLIPNIVIYSGKDPLIVGPGPKVEKINQEDIKFFTSGEKTSRDWSSLFEQSPEVDIQSIQMARKLKEAYQSAKNLKDAPDLKHYHQSVIADGMDQFEEKETTLSHLYRFPHPALNNLSYGEALCERFLDNLKIGSKILEVGGGTGYVAKNFLNRLKIQSPEIYNSIEYTILDLAPALSASQKKLCHDHVSKMKFINGDIQQFESEDKYDLIISNEMIADLEVSVASVVNLNNLKVESEGEKQILKYKINYQSAPPLFLVNTGAMKFIENLQNLLSKNGVAFISEYGGMEAYPVAVKLSGHFEHSIRYQDLMEVALKNNLSGSCETVAKILSFDGNYEILSKHSYGLISDVLLPHLGLKRLERLPYDRESLAKELGPLKDKLINLNFYPLKDQKDLLNPYRFLALILQKK